MPRFLNNVRSRPRAVLVAITVPLVVVLWHLFALAARPAHLNQVVAELGSTMRFVADPIPNHACTKLIFIQTTEKGYGVFFSEAPGKRKLVFEQPSGGAGYGNLDESLMGWSPDDQLFAYGRHTYQWEVIICNGNTGAEIAVLPFNHFVAGAAWFSPELLVFADSERVLHTVRNHHDQWVQPQPFKFFRDAANPLPGDPIRGFAAYDADSVVWQQGGTLFACGPDSDAPTALWESTAGNRLLEFSVAPPRKLLVHAWDAKGEYFAHYYPTNRITDVTRITDYQRRPSHLSLVNDAHGYAFLIQTGTKPDTLVVKPDDSHPATEIQWQDRVRFLAAGKEAVYVISSLNDQPPGIWRCDVASGATECVVPNVEKPFRYVLDSHIALTAITNAAGERLTCYVLSPAHLTSGRKHPLVIGILGYQEMGFTWSANHEAIANCGAFFATVDRERRSYPQWADDAFALYEDLVKRPDIDANKVYLYGDSAGNSTVYELLQRNPKLWRGVILFSPTHFPAPSDFAGLRIFIDNGGADPNFGPRGIQVPMDFQDAAAKAGIPVTLLIHPGLGHIFRMPAGERERMREALIFLGGG